MNEALGCVCDYCNKFVLNHWEISCVYHLWDLFDPNGCLATADLFTIYLNL